MANGLVSILAVIAMLLAFGTALGQLDRRNFAFRWLFIAAALVLLNDAALTGLYGALPNLLPSSEWNWQGKLLALAITLAIASLAAFGWRRSGITVSQHREGRLLTWGVALLVCLTFVGIALALPNEPLDQEALAFQLTIPGLEEETFYRGILLLALDQAFRGRTRMLGIDIGWGALLTCILFGFGHAFGYGKDGFSFDWLTMLLTAGPAFILVWLRARTGSLVLPVLLHNFANAISMLL